MKEDTSRSVVLASLIWLRPLFFYNINIITIALDVMMMSIMMVITMRKEVMIKKEKEDDC